MIKCRAKQYSDQMHCSCGNVWDMNDENRPVCGSEIVVVAHKVALGLAWIYVVVAVVIGTIVIISVIMS